MRLRKNPECPVCGKNPTITKLIDYEQFCGIGLGQEEATVHTNGNINSVLQRTLASIKTALSVARSLLYRRLYPRHKGEKS